MSPRHEWFTNFTLLPRPVKITLGDDNTITTTGIGTITTCTFNGTCWALALLQDILYIPHLHGNLLSVSHIARCGYETHFASNNCHILDHMGETACTGHLHSNLYVMNIQVASTENAHVTHLDQLSQDEETLKYTLTAHTSTLEASLATRHHCLDQPHTNGVKHKTMFNNQGDTLLHCSGCNPLL